MASKAGLTYSMTPFGSVMNTASVVFSRALDSWRTTSRDRRCAVTSRKTITPPAGPPFSSRSGALLMLIQAPSGLFGFRMNISAS